MDIARTEMTEPIERLFERDFPSPLGVVQETEDANALADLLYVENEKTGLHAVRVETSYDDCIFDLSAGIHAAQDIPANKRWVALPLDAFRDGEESFRGVMSQQCRKRGVGIITIQTRGLGFSAKVILDAEESEGRYVEAHPELYSRWKAAAADPMAAKGWRVVEH